MSNFAKNVDILATSLSDLYYST